MPAFEKIQDGLQEAIAIAPALAERDAEIARLRHHISRAWVNLSCGMIDAAKAELEQAHTQ